jgi:hypothetical protein
MADKEATKIRYTIDGGKSYDLDLKTVTIRERIDVEEFLGMPWAEANSSGWIFSEKGQAFFAYLAVRRKRKTATFEEILSAEDLTVEINPKDPPTKRASKKTPDSSGSQS